MTECVTLTLSLSVNILSEGLSEPVTLNSVIGLYTTLFRFLRIYRC